MDAKALYWSTYRLFRARNQHTLPQMQLRYGRIEKWFVPEFVAAMNMSLGRSNRVLKLLEAYADTEVKNVDISVWERSNAEIPAAIYEAKVIYNGDGIEAIVDKAKDQIASSPLASDKKIALFLLVFARECVADSECDHSDQIKTLCDRTRDVIRSREFDSDHHIRISELTELVQVEYPRQTWHTQSWLTWGYHNAA